MNNDLFTNGIVRIAVIGVLAILALFLLVETIDGAQNFGRSANPPTNTITVSGTGTASLAPDIAHITFTAMDSEPTAAAAQEKATKQGNDAISYVKQQGIADKDITTLSYTISPQYSYTPCPRGTFCPNNGNTITGYEVSETVQVTVRDLDKVSTILSGLGQLNVGQISGPDFALESPTAGQDAARAKAIDNAKQEAAILAGQLGVHLGSIVSFNENTGGYPVYGLGAGASFKSADAAAAPAPTVPTGENTYTSNVTITYEIR